MALFGRHRTDPAAAFVQEFRETHDLFLAVLLLDQFSNEPDGMNGLAPIRSD